MTYNAATTSGLTARRKDAETTEQTAVAASSKLRQKLGLPELPLESARRCASAGPPSPRCCKIHSTGMLR